MKKSEKRQVKTLYFDYAAASPITKKAFEAMNMAYGEDFGNPSSAHYAGMNAMSLLDEARELTAKAVGGEFDGVIFASSATEANNLILRGVVKEYTRRAQTESVGLPARVIISSVEHESIDRTAMKLSEEGAEIIRLPAGKDGKADLKNLRDYLNNRTVIVSLIFTNNETGAINDIFAASKIIKSVKKNGCYPLLHTDASQSFQYQDCSFEATGADIITLSSHKIGGPKGVGAAIFGQSSFIKLLSPYIYGGGQEFNIRAGTENIPAIYGFKVAAEESLNIREKESKRVMKLKMSLIREMARVFPQIKINGPKPENGSPHIVNLWLPNILAEEMVIAMNMEGVAISYGSACFAKTFKNSKVLAEMKYSEKRIKESVRISLGRNTKEKDIYRFAEVFKKTLKMFK